MAKFHCTGGRTFNLMLFERLQHLPIKSMFKEDDYVNNRILDI